MKVFTVPITVLVNVTTDDAERAKEIAIWALYQELKINDLTMAAQEPIETSLESVPFAYTGDMLSVAADRKDPSINLFGFKV